MEAAWQKNQDGLGRYPLAILFWMIGVIPITSYLLDKVMWIHVRLHQPSAQLLWSSWVNWYSPGGYVFWAVVQIGILVAMLTWVRRTGSLYCALKPGRISAIGLALAVLIIGFVWSADLLIGRAADAMVGISEYYPWRPEYYTAPRSDLFLWEAISVVALAPVIEEIAFRNLGMGCLIKRGWGSVSAVLVTSILFAIVHTQYVPSAIFGIFVSGLALGALRLTTGGIAIPILAHVGMNLLYLSWYAHEMNVTNSSVF